MAAEIVWGLGRWGSGLFQSREHMPPAKCRPRAGGGWAMGVSRALVESLLYLWIPAPICWVSGREPRDSGGMWELNIQAHNAKCLILCHILTLIQALVAGLSRMDREKAVSSHIYRWSDQFKGKQLWWAWKGYAYVFVCILDVLQLKSSEFSICKQIFSQY